MSEFKYVGSELDLFAAAHNWKSYWSSRIRPFINGDILEVGAGIGANTPYLDHGGNRRWVCLEPDSNLATRLTLNLGKTGVGREYEIVCGTVQQLESGRFDTILYIDVLEHIENDREELEAASTLLKDGGHLIVLSPAHQHLFTPFDAAIGHFRRYNRSMLQNISPPSLRLEEVWYLDSAGLLLSVANLLFLHRSMPRKGQIAFWDRCVVPVSRFVDRCFLSSVGKSIVGIWLRENE